MSQYPVCLIETHTLTHTCTLSRIVIGIACELEKSSGQHIRVRVCSSVRERTKKEREREREREEKR